MGIVTAEDYKIEVMKDHDTGEGYLAYISQLDCWGDGNTAVEAYNDVIIVANEILAIAKEDGIPIPVPKKEVYEDEYSGKLSLRLPKFLHAEVAKRADKEDCSINQLIQTFISMGIGMKYGEEKITINIKAPTDKLQKTVNRESNWDYWKKDLNRNLDRKGVIACQ